MQDLDFSFNSGLSGPIPTWLGNLSTLKYLYLRFTGLSGPVPTGLGTLTNLAELHLAATDWTGRRFHRPCWTNRARTP